jgi:L-threonylcarbamoyladenylate synthase
MLIAALNYLQQPAAVIVLPTDTVYGLACRATDVAAVTRLYALKTRHHKPGTVIAASIDQLVALGIKRRYLSAVEQFWPGPISVVVPSGPELGYLDLTVGSLAVRIPADAAMRDFLTQSGPLLTSSANLPSEPPATTVTEAEHYFHDQVDYYEDAGSLAGRLPSTVIRMVDDAIEVLRPGAVTIDENGRLTT